MRYPHFILCLLTGTAALFAQAHFTQESAIRIDVAGKPFATFHYGETAAKPFLAPLRSASGKVVTRRFPMDTIEGESRDHLHHRGLWFTYDDVNGVKFWENDPSYDKKPNKGRVVVTSTKFDDKTSTLHAVMEWRDPAGKPLLIEDRKMVFSGDDKLRMIDFQISLTAATNVTLGDTKEGAFAIRLAEEFTAKRGGQMVNADGLTTMKQVWGKKSNWVDYSAQLQGEQLGVAIFDHPSNPGFPTRWHARDYGLFSLNPFGQKGFDESLPAYSHKLATGEKMNFKWRVVIHPGDATTGGVAALYKEFAASK